MEPIQLGHYCSKRLPGPQVSEERSSAMRVVFSSNAQGINTGFRAKYEFIDKKPVSKRTSRVFAVRVNRATIKKTRQAFREQGVNLVHSFHHHAAFRRLFFLV